MAGSGLNQEHFCNFADWQVQALGLIHGEGADNDPAAQARGTALQPSPAGIHPKKLSQRVTVVPEDVLRPCAWLRPTCSLTDTYDDSAHCTARTVPRYRALGVPCPNASPPIPGDALIGFLNQSIDWYRRVQLPGQLSTDPADSIYTAYNRNASVQAISLIFDYAREQAQQIQLEHPHDTAPVADNPQTSRNLPQLVASAQEKVKQTGADLEALEQQAANASGKKRQTLDDQVAEEKSEPNSPRLAWKLCRI